jgi:hypothetical protein
VTLCDYAPRSCQQRVKRECGYIIDGCRQASINEEINLGPDGLQLHIALEGIGSDPAAQKAIS